MGIPFREARRGVASAPFVQKDPAMNNTLEHIQPSLTLAITSRAKQLRAEGHSVCNFSAGEPDFDTPESAKAACVEALMAGRTKYTPAAGAPALRAAISEKLRQENGIDVAEDQIIVSCGAKHSLANAFLALCNPGDEVVIPAPYWLSYPEMVRLAGGVPVFVPTTPATGLKMRPEQLEAVITPRTVALVLNTPCNPTGAVYTEEELRALAEVCVRHGVYIISDEIYERLVYDGARHVSVASLSPEIAARTLTVNGFSKAFAMTGWRMGYAAGPREFIRAMTTVQSHTAGPPATFAQYGGVFSLGHCEESVLRMVAAFAERRDRIVELLRGIPGVSCVEPHGAFYVFPDISSFGLDSQTFARRLLDERHVALVPGAAFGSDANVRLSYACGMDEIEEGLSRIRDFCGNL